MDTCKSWQAPYEIFNSNFRGNDALSTCKAWVDSSQYLSNAGPLVWSLTGDLCRYDTPPAQEDAYYDYITVSQVCEGSTATPGQAINCDAACTISLALVSPEVEPQKFQDMAQIGGLFAGAAILILCVRKVYDLFDKAPHGDS